LAQQGCGPEQAFDLLRRASQRANVKVLMLAAQLVEHVASGGKGQQRDADLGRCHQAPASLTAGTARRLRGCGRSW
jgi:hypothetical protein